MRRRAARFLTWLVVFVVSTGHLLAQAEPATDAGAAKTLYYGAISTNPKKTVAKAQPFADYLASALAEYGYRDAKVMVAQSEPQMRRWLQQGKVDILSETLFSASDLMNRKLVDVVGLRWKKGVREYHSMFYTRKDSGIQSLSDLNGHIVVFEDKGSTSAFFEPAAQMLDAGLTLVKLSSLRDQAMADEVGYIFANEVSHAGGEVNMWTWVYNGIVAASAFSNLDWDREIPPRQREKLAVIAESKPVPRSLMLIRSSLADDVHRALTVAMFEAHNSNAGANALDRYRSTTKIEPLPSQMLATVATAAQRRHAVLEQLVED